MPEREKKARAQQLRALSDAKSLAYRQRFVGQTLAVIVEEGLVQGMSENYLKVQLNANGFALQPNDVTLVWITEVTESETVGKVLSVVQANALPVA